MSLSQKIDRDYISAYKEKDQIKVGVLRLLKSAAKNRLVELSRTHGELEDTELLDVIIKQAKQRQDSIEQYLKANRKDLADREKLELDILSSYLPEKIGDEELNEAIILAINETGAQSPRDMGKVMKFLMDKYKGAVDGKQLSEKVKTMLVK